MRTPPSADCLNVQVSSAHEVYAIKGYTNYAIGMAGAMIIESILLDSHRTLPVSTLIQGFNGVSTTYACRFP